MDFTGKALLAQIVADSKTDCTAPYRVGYSYSWEAGRSRLVCRECGRPDTDHETTRQAAQRTAREMYDGEV